MAYLEIKGLSFSIEGKEILSDISFSLEKGEVTLIAGKNGSGKSFLLKCIKGLERMQSGTVSLDGRILSKQKERMKAFALVFQDASLQIVGSTVEKDIAFGLENVGLEEEEVRKRTDEYIDFFCLEKTRKLRPQVLSGGEKRKLAIAGALSMSSDVLLLDEPFANLDYPSVRTVIETIDSLKASGVTVIIVSHEAEKFLFHTDRTVIIESGRIADQGRSQDMMESLRRHDVYIPSRASFEELSWLR